MFGIVVQMLWMGYFIGDYYCWHTGLNALVSSIVVSICCNFLGGVEECCCVVEGSVVVPLMVLYISLGKMII